MKVPAARTLLLLDSISMKTKLIVTPHRFALGFVGIIVVLTCLWMLGGVAIAGKSTQSISWSAPKFIASNASAPLIIGDSSGLLHVLYVEGWYDKEGGPEGQAIMYTKRDDATWSDPIDVITSPSKTGITLDGVAVDEQGNLHLLWNDLGALYHSIVHLSQAHESGAWRTDTVIAGQEPLADLALDNAGTLHVAVRPDPFSLSYLSSADGGRTWSNPTTIASIDDTEAYAIGGVQLAAASPDTVHVTWFHTAAEVDWNFWSVWYARSDTRGQSWIEPQEMAQPRFGASDIAVDTNGGIHLVYGRNIGQPDGRWYQWSQDGGKTWTVREPLFPGFDYASGDTGGYGFASDSAGVLHLVNSFGREDGEATAYHLEWLGKIWSEPDLVMAKHAHFPRIAMTEGNRLNFVAMAGYEYELWYRTGMADAPATAPVAVPTAGVPSQQISDDTTAQAVSLSEPDTTVPSPDAPNTAMPMNTAASPNSGLFQNPIFLGVASAAILVAVAVIFKRLLAARGWR